MKHILTLNDWIAFTTWLLLVSTTDLRECNEKSYSHLQSEYEWAYGTIV